MGTRREPSRGEGVRRPERRARLQTCIRSLNVGASAYILKPLDIDPITNLLKETLDQQKQTLADRRRLRQYQALSELTEAALLAGGTDELLHSLLSQIMAALRADVGVLLLLDQSGQRLEVRAAVGVEEASARGWSEALREGIAGLPHRPVVRPEKGTGEGATDSFFGVSGIQSQAGLPVRTPRRPVGLVQIGRRRSDTFSREEIRLGEALAARAALLIDRLIYQT
jgi:GAF domain-containing protein